MKVFAVCGFSNSGKTTTVECIINELVARGYKVGSIKHIHCDDFKMDSDPERDTSRHRAAGSRLVSAHAKQETALLFSHRLPTQKLLTLYQGECDWVVCEGISDITIPTIITAHSEDDILKKWNDMVFCISGVVSASIDGYNGVPAIDATRKIGELVDLIEDTVCDSALDFVGNH